MNNNQSETTLTPAPAKPGAPQPPASRATLKRVLVLGAVTAASLALLGWGASWLKYRAGHTVLNHATVKGRVHRIGARIEGQVKTIEVQPGQRVCKGTPLIRMEDAHLQAALRQAQAGLQSALKQYDAEQLAIAHERRRLPLEVERCEAVNQATAGEVEAVVSNQERIEQEFNRLTTLLAAGIASASEMDRVKAERNHARALVKAARGNLAATESNCRVAQTQVEGLRVREAGLAVLLAEIESARQRVAAAEADLGATLICAPEDGWVAERLVEAGGSAKVGEPILSLWLGTPWVEAWADEKNLAHIRAGNAVDVTLTAFPDRKLRGQVSAIGVLTDQELQAVNVPSSLHSIFRRHAMVPIQITVAAADLRLQPGLTALVGIEHSTSSTTAQVVPPSDRSVTALARTIQSQK